MNAKLLKCLLDIESVMLEIESIKERVGNDFHRFKSYFVMKRAAERDLEIIGEAVNKLLKIMPSLPISEKSNIIGLRNLIIHSYDSIDDELIWCVIQKDIPKLKSEIAKIKTGGYF